jgi:homoserine kinase type II
MNYSVHFVLKQFRANVWDQTITALDNAGGFSGAELWRVRQANRDLCLRRWPREHPSGQQLRFIHDVLRQGGQYLSFLPRVLATPAGDTFVSHDEHFWELTTWLPGEANYRQAPSRARFSAALIALAEFHQATRDFSGGARVAPSPGMEQRLAQLFDWDSAWIEHIRDRLPRCDWPELREPAEETIQLYGVLRSHVKIALQFAMTKEVRLQPCLRDIWHDHVLFTGDRVTGLVDFGALRIETVAGDVARLLGSLAGDDREAWQAGLAAYAALRPLDEVETALVEVFDASSVLLSNLNWLDWIILEQRQFVNRRPILERINETLARLRTLAFRFQRIIFSRA